MGLIKKSKYNVMGIELSSAYAKICRLYIEDGNKVKAYFGISSNRENLEKNYILKEECFETEINKDEKIYEQVYIKAKEKVFSDWEDDITE